jgi:hypothetical protein
MPAKSLMPSYCQGNSESYELFTLRAGTRCAVMAACLLPSIYWCTLHSIRGQKSCFVYALSLPHSGLFAHTLPVSIKNVFGTNGMKILLGGAWGPVDAGTQQVWFGLYCGYVDKIPCWIGALCSTGWQLGLCGCAPWTFFLFSQILARRGP